MRHPHDHDHNCNLPNVIGRPLPDNWPFGRPHRHPMDDFHEHFLSGFDPKVPSNGTVVSDVIDSIRAAKIAFNSTHSVPAVFARDVQDGDIVIPILCIQEGNTACNELMDALFRMRRIPDAIWVPAFRKTLDEDVAALSDIDFDSYKPAFYGVAYVHIGRVMIGPVVAHPRYKFHTGSKLYATDNGDLTTENTGTLVGVCLAPGSFYLAPYASTLKQLFEDYYDQTIKDVVNKIENEGVDAGNVTVTVPGTTTDRPLANRFGDVVNIKDFGAKGDGVTNNTVAVNAAVAYANKLSGPACLFIPVGTYLVDAIPNVPCYGPGSLKTTAKAYGAFELLFKINGAIQKDANGRFTVNLDQLSVDDLKKLIESMLPETGGGLTTDEDGKLVIDFSQMTPAELMVILKQLISPNGGLIVGDDNKLAVDFKDLSKEDLEEIIQGMLPESGGGLETDEEGKLVINFENLTKEELTTLTTVLIQEGGGLAVDEDGKLYVDFSQMPTNKFEALLKSIRVPIWLNKNTTFYVDGTNGSDTIVEGIGTESKPFKTIQAAVYYVCDNYNVSKYVATIFVKNGTYLENIILPDFSRSTGYCMIQGESKHGVSIGQSKASPGTAIYANQPGYWRLKNLDVKADNKLNTSTNAYYTGIDASNGCIMYLEDVAVILEQIENVGDATVNRIRGICGTGGTINIGTGCSINGVNTASVNKISALVSYYSCRININYSDSAGDKLDISGDFSVVASANGGGIIRVYPNLPTIQGTATGKRYATGTGGYISVSGAGEEYFPGSINGTVGENSWYE